MTKEVGRQKWQRRGSTTGEGTVETNIQSNWLMQTEDGQMIPGDKSPATPVVTQQLSCDYPQPNPLVK